MYRVFESLDQLNQIVEEAYGVPMTTNCMVPRREVADLLDQIRDALPAEIDDAQDVLDQRDDIINDAEQRAAATVADAEAEAIRRVDEATDRAEATIADAEERASMTVAKAQDEAERRREDADREYRQVTDRAAAEADRLVTAGNAAYDRSVQEGLEEQQRLISDSEVVREATEEARRINEAAHADSNRLRGECDRYIDSKLAEFEESLSTTLRTVGRDRAALRQGAGASGRYGRDSVRDRSRGDRGYDDSYDDDERDYRR
ncbi:DivIVA domain-containing protein [Corynebacterium sp. TAE3-ERU12]|uniref:DivIVA domain-containing protein n=1 Tax=Corynebacterium sp. TAE3-ERU12 TaxID=2849491 RepID=UPI001C46F595|nr:DivIVA domain-containing protein [Corynebacterium sp. TAE3-ERU12]MBV7295197.1 DivIVA domain-containing protein [Corynebacterium sp. TAE3-ERU12]